MCKKHRKTLYHQPDDLIFDKMVHNDSSYHERLPMYHCEHQELTNTSEESILVSSEATQTNTIADDDDTNRKLLPTHHTNYNKSRKYLQIASSSLQSYVSSSFIPSAKISQSAETIDSSTVVISTLTNLKLEATESLIDDTDQPFFLKEPAISSPLMAKQITDKDNHQINVSANTSCFKELYNDLLTTKSPRITEKRTISGNSISTIPTSGNNLFDSNPSVSSNRHCRTSVSQAQHLKEQNLISSSMSSVENSIFYTSNIATPKKSVQAIQPQINQLEAQNAYRII